MKKRNLWFLLLLGGFLSMAGTAGAEDAESVSEVELAVIGLASPESLWNEVGISQGDAVQVDPATLADRLRALPWVESVEKEKGEAGRVRLLVTERRPLAMLICPGAGVGLQPSQNAMVIDRHAVAISATAYPDLVNELAQLPRIHVLRVEHLEEGRTVPGPATEAAVELLKRTRSLEGLWKMAELKQLNDYSIEASFEQGPVVQFSFHDVEGQLQKLLVLKSYARERQRALKTVNLVLRRNIPVTFAGE